MEKLSFKAICLTFALLCSCMQTNIYAQETTVNELDTGAQQGMDIPDQFYSPDYSKLQIPEKATDYRRTIYWNPSLQLDEEGMSFAIIKLFLNSYL